MATEVKVNTEKHWILHMMELWGFRLDSSCILEQCMVYPVFVSHFEQETGNISLSSLSPDRKRWTLPPSFGFWLISVPQKQTEPETEHNRSRPTPGPGNSNVSPLWFVLLQLSFVVGDLWSTNDSSSKNMISCVFSCFPVIWSGQRWKDFQRGASSGL